MADLPVSPIRLLASLRKLSKRFLVADEELRIARDAWDDANLSRMESESADSELLGDLAADEDRLEAAMMQLSDQYFEIEDTIDSVARDLAFVIPWPTDKIAEAIRRLETKLGLRPHHFIDGRTLDDLQEFPCLVLAIDKTDWPSLALLPDLMIQGNAEASKEVAEQSPPPPLANDGSDAARTPIEIADDGRSARWGNEMFTFTPLQAQLIVRLNASRLHGTGIVSEADLQEAASETDQPVRSVFRDKKLKGPHAAIKRGFIVPAGGKGLWKITDQSPL